MNNNELSKLIQSYAQSSGSSADKAAQQKVMKLLGKLSGTQAEQIAQLLNNPEKSREILNSPEAQALRKKLNG